MKKIVPIEFVSYDLGIRVFSRKSKDVVTTVLEEDESAMIMDKVINDNRG